MALNFKAQPSKLETLGTPGDSGLAEHGGVDADLQRSIEAGRQAVDSCPSGSVFRAACLANLAVALRAREHRGDLHQAIALSRDAARHRPLLAIGVAVAATWLVATLVRGSRRD